MRWRNASRSTGEPWPAIPEVLGALWDEIASAPPPDCCLVNLYRAGARMGLHQDRDENNLAAPVIGVSLGDDALFMDGFAATANMIKIFVFLVTGQS